MHSSHIAAAVLLTAITVSPALGAARVTELDGVAAVVDNNVVTLQELDSRVSAVKQRLAGEVTRLPADDILRRQVLDRLILERLQLDLAKRIGILVDDEAVNETVARVAAENGLDLETFRKVLQQDGMTFAEFREQIRNEMTIGRLRAREVDNRVNVSPREVDEYLARQTQQEVADAEYRLAHILVALPAAPTPKQVRAAREKADQLVADLKGGANFRELAVARSDGQQALEGGDLGWRRGDQLPSLFADEVVDMADGEVRGPIRSPSGFHIIQLDGRRGEARHMVQQTHARHILIKTDELTSSADARRQLNRLRSRVLAGEDFAELARNRSDDPGSAVKGGDLGWANPGTFVPAFERTLESLAPGELSTPFQSEFGWHIVQLLERRDHDDTDAYLRSHAHRTIRQRKAEEALQNWLRELRDEAYVDVRLSS